MTFDEAKNLIEDKDQKYDEDARNLWLTGFLLFHKYRPKFDLAGAEHDILYVTEFIEEMEEEENSHAGPHGVPP